MNKKTMDPHPDSADIPYQYQTQATSSGIDSDTECTSIYSDNAALIPLSKDESQSGSGNQQYLSRGLQIPSKSYRLTSGFKYPSTLSTYGVSQEDWLRFTHEITENAKLSRSQWTTVVGVGIGTMTVGAMIFGAFGAIPAVIAARRKRANQESRNLAKAMGTSPVQSQEDLGKPEGEENKDSLSYKISQWNETFFNPRGLLVRVDLPYEMSAVEEGLDVAKKSLRRSLEASLPTDDSRQKERYKASHRCRIVVIPLDQMPESGATLTAESPYMPAVYE